jgi:ribosomal protein L40E
MTRLLARITRRRDSADVGPTHQAAGATAPTPPDQPTAVAPSAGGQSSAPAGTEPVAAARPGFRERSRLRRRLQYLRRVRELGFRDLGGLVFDQHRFARPDESLVQAKLTALAAVDGELRAIERALHEERPITELREVGVSACARCGALIGSDARFCSSCGADVHGARDVAPVVLSAPATSPATTGDPATAGSPPTASADRTASPAPAGGESSGRPTAPETPTGEPDAGRQRGGERPAAPDRPGGEPEPGQQRAGATPLAARVGAWAGGGAPPDTPATAPQEPPQPDPANGGEGAPERREGA